MRPTVLLLALPLAYSVAGSPAVATAAGERVNVLFIMDDQHNPRMMGGDSNGYGGVNGSLTPSLDQLATEGVRFPRAYCTSPQCQPSRFSLLTGQYPHTTGLRANKIWEPVGELSWVELARRQGYRTGFFGKHHMMWLEQQEPLDDHGFDEALDMDDYDAWCEANGLEPYDSPQVTWNMPGLPPELKAVGHTSVINAHHPSGWFSDLTIEFLEQRAADGEPFVAWLSFYGPHTPIFPSNDVDPNDWAHSEFPFTDLTLPPNQAKVAAVERTAQVQAKYASMTPDQHREVLAYYYGYVRQIDHNVGRVLDRLEELGLEEDTVVVFTADHGECGGEMGCWKKGAGCFECLVRVPLLFRLPGVLPAGHVSDVVASGVDLAPTLIELCGFSPKRGERRGLEGGSLLGAMRREIVPTGWPQRAFASLGSQASPHGRHRLVVTPQDKYNHDEWRVTVEEYYDLVSDPWELDNRVNDPAYTGRVSLLRSMLDRWWGDEGQHAPKYRVTGNKDARPQMIKEPWPEDGATLVPTDVDLEWLASTSAAECVLWLGTTSTGLAHFKDLPAMASGANLGSLLPGQAYYWRVDTVNETAPQPGVVYQFTTDPAGAAGPRLALDPVPADWESGVALGTWLRWTPGSGAQAQEVWFGVEHGPLQLIASGDGTLDEVAPPALRGGRTYRWRVDGVGGGGETVGDVWTFTSTSNGLPARATAPDPAHLSTDVTMPLAGELSWAPVAGASRYRAYFGTEFPLERVHVGPETSWQPGPLELGAVYYWRIDVVNAKGVTRGATWRFEAAGS